MKTLQDIDPRFKHIGKKVFVFILAAVLVIFAAIYFLGKEKDLFSKKLRLFFVTNTADGLSEGMAVKISGFRIGKVKSVTMDDNAKVVVTLSVNKKYQKWIRQDSFAALKKENFIGEGIIEISFGSPDKPLLADHAEITFKRSKGVEEMANEMVQEFKPAALKARDFIANITDPNGELSKILKNAAALTGELRETNKKVSELLDESRPIVKNVKTGSETIPDIAKNVKELTGTMTQEVPVLLKEAKTVMQNVNKASSEVIKEAPKVRPLLENVEDLTEDSKEITDSLKKNWFIKKNMPPSPPPAYISPKEVPVGTPGGAQ